MRPSPNLDPFSALTDGALTGWHQAIEELALRAWTTLGEGDWVVVSQRLEDARRAGKIDSALENAFHTLFWKALQVSAVYGYALAKCFRGSPAAGARS